MFRRLPGSLPKEASFPEPFDKLGYVLNGHSQVRKVDNPDEPFRYYITNNERYNDMQREAVHECLRQEFLTRMVHLGFQPIYLPLLITSKPAGPHVPILCTPQATLKTRRRILVIVNDTTQDLGIWSWRVAVASNGGLEVGSCLSFIRELKKRAETNGQEEPGIVLLNPGQIWYSWNMNKALTDDSWKYLPRSSLVHPRVESDPQWNTVEGSRNPDEHIAFVFENIVADESWVAKDAELYILANYTGALSLLKYLNANFSKHAAQLTALSLVSPFEDRSIITNPDLLSFLRNRTRSIAFCNGPTGACIAAPYHRPAPNAQGYAEEPALWPELASGPIQSHGYNPRAANQEVVMPNVFPMALDWFEEVTAAMEFDGIYQNPTFDIYDLAAAQQAEEAEAEAKLNTEAEAEAAPRVEEISVGVKGLRTADKAEPAKGACLSGVEDIGAVAGFDDESETQECMDVGGAQVPIEFMRKAGLLHED